MTPRIGRVFGRLTVKAFIGGNYRHDGSKRYLCTCSCGNTKDVSWNSLRSGSTKSCGCLAAENMNRLLVQGAQTRKAKEERIKARAETPKLTKHELYPTWRGMRNRCYNKKHDSYKFYGAKGVTICDRWRFDFWAFVEDMGQRPKGMTLDRINPDGIYEPDNCRWVSQIEQASNTRRGINVNTATLSGKTMTVAAWCRKYECSFDAAIKLIRDGNSPELSVLIAALRKRAWVKSGGKATPADYAKCVDVAKQALEAKNFPG